MSNIKCYISVLSKQNLIAVTISSNIFCCFIYILSYFLQYML